MYAVTGVYDPFSSDGWRALASSPSPWAFSGGEQLVPVIDVLAVDQETQVQALRTGVLPRPQRTASTGTVWLVLMGVGVALAVTGLVLRRRVAPAQRSGRPYGLPPEEPEEVEEVVESASATADTPAPEDAVESELDRPFGLPPLDDEDDATAGAVEQGVKEGVEHGVDEGDEDDVADDEVDAVRASANDDGAAPNLDAVDAGVDDAAPDHVQAAPEPGVEDVEGVREGEIEPANDHGVAEADYTEDSAEALEEEAAEPTQAETADPFSGFDVTDTEDEDEEEVDLTGFDRRKSP